MFFEVWHKCLSQGKTCVRVDQPVKNEKEIKWAARELFSLLHKNFSSVLRVISEGSLNAQNRRERYAAGNKRSLHAGRIGGAVRNRQKTDDCSDPHGADPGHQNRQTLVYPQDSAGPPIAAGREACQRDSAISADWISKEKTMEELFPQRRLKGIGEAGVQPATPTRNKPM